MKKHFYTNEEVEWLKDKWFNTILSSYKIAELFNEEFKPDVEINGSKINDLLIKRHHLKRGFNSGRYGVGRVKEHNPIGTVLSSVHYRNEDGNDFYYKRIKVDNIKNDNTTSGGSVWNKNYMPLQKYIYEQAFGKLKDDEFVIFLDGDRNNFDLDNLAVVNKKINGALSGYHSQSKKKITKAMIEVIKTELEIKKI